MPARIMSVNELLSMELRIPDYQRPYRWTTKNVADLLKDIDGAIADERKYHGEFKYRIGSVILHEVGNESEGQPRGERSEARVEEHHHFDLVDGQQRVLTLILLWLCLEELADPDGKAGSDEHIPLLDRGKFRHPETQRNIKDNYDFISDWIGSQTPGWRYYVRKAFEDVLEAVVITVDDVEEAFQLFDSQNTRGRSLNPHDLLKAYHLRAMRDDTHEMRHVVTRWEELPDEGVSDGRGHEASGHAVSKQEIFARYLYPILNWSSGRKTDRFTSKKIDVFKGTPIDSGYTYALRAWRASPYFQIGRPFIEGKDFFLMTEHYIRMCEDIAREIEQNPELRGMHEHMAKACTDSGATTGIRYARWLLHCSLLAYYDRFHNFEARAVRKLFVWAFMVRVDMTTLGLASINKYAVGEDNGQFTNKVPMFVRIAHARHHTDIANLVIRNDSIARAKLDKEGPSFTERQNLAAFLRNL